MTEQELADRIRPHIAVDDSGQDDDTIILMNTGGNLAKHRLSSPSLHRQIGKGRMRTPDGTRIPGWDPVQLAFQNALTEKTGMCVLEHDYHRSGHPDLAALARSARGA